MKQPFIASALCAHFDPENLFEQVDQLKGESYREVGGRRTIRTKIGDTYYFAKIHFGVGWKEIFKNLLQGRLPVLGARNEWLAVQALHKANVPSMEAVLFCETGRNPASRRSAIITRSLEDTISLEDFYPKNILLKRQLINEVATMARRMHQAGINHRDFYLCHFLMDQQSEAAPVLHLIDLHRAQIRDRVPLRWQVKDIGGLLFSAFDKPLTRRDLLRFIRCYENKALRDLLPTRRLFWRQVIHRAKKLYLQDHESLPAEIEKLLVVP